MTKIFTNVSIDKMSFVNSKHDIRFEFIDSYAGSCKSCGDLLCKSIFAMKLDTAFEAGEEFPFPCFICDITLNKLEDDNIDLKFKELNYTYRNSDELAMPESKEYYLVRMEGGEIDISIICGEVAIVK